MKNTALLLLVSFFVSLTAWAGGEVIEKRIIALDTEDAGFIEMDVSDLAIGESQTFTSASGKVVDVMRTAEGMEVYVDGELLDMPAIPDVPHPPHAPHAPHTIVADGDFEFEFECHDADGDCDLQTIDHNVWVECIDDEGESCDGHGIVVMQAGEVVDIDVEVIEEGHATIIRKQIDGEQADGTQRVIIVERKVTSEDEI